MSPLSSFAEHAVDLLTGVGQVKARAMFGGYGLSLDGISIGLISDDRIYLRIDDATRPQFESAGSAPFIYQSKNGPMTMKNYWALPEDSVDDPERAAKWGKLAAEAARRAESSKGSKKKATATAAKAKAKPTLKAAPRSKSTPKPKPARGVATAKRRSRR